MAGANDRIKERFIFLNNLLSKIERSLDYFVLKSFLQF